jgi:formate hydrogenlyase transcriptional activator
MNSDPQSQPADSLLPQYQALLETVEAMAMHSDLPTLLQDQVGRLRRIIQADTISVTFHDPARQVMRVQWVDSRVPTDIAVGAELPIEGSLHGVVWQTQQPVWIPDSAQESQHPQLLTSLHPWALRSQYVVPLTAAGRRLGALAFGSVRAFAYGEAEQALCQQAAKQVTIAINNVLHFQHGHAAQQRLTRERDRLQLLLEVTNAVASILDLRDLMRAIYASLRRVIPHDGSALILYEPGRQQLHVPSWEFPDHESILEEVTFVPVERTAPGLVFTSRQPALLTAPLDPAAFPADITLKRVFAVGIKSVCFVPLICHDRPLGVLAVGSFRATAFLLEDVELLSQVAQQLAIAVENSLAFREIKILKDKLAGEKQYLEEELRHTYDFERIIGQSAALQRVLQQVKMVAATDSTVLIQGETGTGKELIAHALHNLSARRERTLVKVNCAAIPTGLLESELFGHEKGAFTGAVTQRIGRFELAHQGTLFLDEVGEIPRELQPKLLRVLQEQEFERLGGTRTIRVDVRVVAATNADLTKLVADKQFRADLYYRLNVFPLTLPPLRERPEDTLLLARWFTQKFARRMKKQIETIPAEAQTALLRYPWPGNVRELENLIERAVILSPGPVLELPIAELTAPVRAGVLPQDATLEAMEREYILRTLRETKWVVSGPAGAAARLGMNRSTLQFKMRKFGITRPT